MKIFKIFGVFFVLRIASVFIVRTWYCSAEYWQSLEVSHKLAFNYGHTSWEWSNGFYSYVYPGVFAILYKALKYFDLDQVELLVLTPRILQALLTTFSDYRFYKWCNNSKWSLYLIITSWYWFYVGSRTLVNTLEASLTVIALSYFPWRQESTVFLWIIHLLFYIRPTALFSWIPLCIWHIKYSKYSALGLILKRYLPIGSATLLIGIGIDYLTYGKVIVTPYEFLKVNVWNEINIQNEQYPWYWYITKALPFIMGINIVPLVISIFQTLRHRILYPQRFILIISILLTILSFSLLTRKEERSILIILPMCLYLCWDFLGKWSIRAPSSLIWIVSLAMVIGNLAPALHMSLNHQRGALEVMPLMEKIAREYRDHDGHRAKIQFLTPCRSMPLYSFIHQNVTLNHITCVPNLQNVFNYIDDSTRFSNDPRAWIRSRLPIHPKSAMPTHIVTFEEFVDRITEFLINYKEIYKIPNSKFVSEHVWGNILVYERIDIKNNEDRAQEDKMDNI